tara:strand:+ start:174 stop:446 length:273 start_codon:yes stop_codon:yes gene_type:complete
MKNKNRTPEFEIAKALKTVTSNPKEKNKILESVTKTVQKNKKKIKCKLNNLSFWCVGCTQSYSIHLKDDNGKLAEQQICPHMTFKSYEMI